MPFMISGIVVNTASYLRNNTKLIRKVKKAILKIENNIKGRKKSYFYDNRNLNSRDRRTCLLFYKRGSEKYPCKINSFCLF